jgi:hypothetical protein
MTVAEKLINLAELYKHGMATPFLERQLDKLLARETEDCLRQIGELNAMLVEFEKRAQQTSDEFLRRWQAGEAGDSLDLTEWASLTQARQFLQKRLALLQGQQV